MEEGINAAKKRRVLKKSFSSPQMTQTQIEKTSPQTPDAMSKVDRSLIAYGVKYLEEKPEKLRLLKINSKPRLLSTSKARKSLSDVDSGFDSGDTSSAGSSVGNASSPTSSEASDVALETQCPLHEDAWTEYTGYEFENLAMSGGGAKGYAYIGALKAFEDSGVLPQLRRIVGTSAGAVIGGMLIVGGTPQEIADFFACDVKKLFQDKNAAKCLFLPRLLTKFGMNSGQRFYEIYGDFLARKTDDPDITFDAIYRRYGKELCVTVTNLSRMCSEYCHYTTTPDLPIRMAIKISMAFPGVYESMKTDLFGTGRNLYIDGGTLENFPVKYFDKIDDETNTPICNEKTIGLYLMSEDQFSHKIWQETFQEPMEPFPTYLPDTKLARERLKEEMKRRKKTNPAFDSSQYTADLKKDPYIQETTGKTFMRHYEASNKDEIVIKGPKNYFKAMLSTLLISQKHTMVQPVDLKRTVGINCGYIDTKDTGMEPGDREFMIRQGYEQTRNFLQNWVRKARSRKPPSKTPKSDVTVTQTLPRPVLQQAPPVVGRRTPHRQFSLPVHLETVQDAHQRAPPPSSLALTPDVTFTIDTPSPEDDAAFDSPECGAVVMRFKEHLKADSRPSSVHSNVSSTIDLSDSIFTRL